MNFQDYLWVGEREAKTVKIISLYTQFMVKYLNIKWLYKLLYFHKESHNNALLRPLKG